MSIISPVSAAESSITSMKKKRQNENMRLQRSRHTLFPPLKPASILWEAYLYHFYMGVWVCDVPTW